MASPEEDDHVENGYMTLRIGADSAVKIWFTLRRASTNGNTLSKPWLIPTGDKPMRYQEQDLFNNSIFIINRSLQHPISLSHSLTHSLTPATNQAKTH